MTPTPRVVLLIGVAGSGKTTVGRRLADALGWAFEDADDHHSVAARTKMSRGEGLTDADRAPWLDRLAALIRHRVQEGPPTVLACSALKASYRERLTAGQPRVFVAWLDVPRGVIEARLAGRRGHYAGVGLASSQFAALEPPADVLRLDGTEPVDAVVETVRRRVEA
ncbi:gluconokinase [Rubrivirga marina]|uniref:Gluconokinase n=1 Tax=Rubrivirga marina TaxID=1196024 RepID=A0A271J231_9BACT|nr:gluconokinase, GntK/IdnK-type [Rubrivirga marina]PAP77552.1 hypothetical protein BSZ37_14430 [Rubrivirga marina]